MSKTTPYSEKAATKVLGFLALMALNLLHGAIVMVGLEYAHSEWEVVPRIGFWGCFWILTALSSVAGALGTGMRVKLDDER